jgi:MarR family transcriptional regulator, organic hydroperoxide resistance regulator
VDAPAYAWRAMSESKSQEAGAPADADDDGDFQTAFWSAKHALAHASAAAFAQHGVHEGQQFVLRCLWREDGLSPGEIARRLGLSTPTVTRAATRMTAAGLLRREPHPSDRRLVRLRLTDRGRKLEKIIDEETRQLTERALATLSAAEREALVAALEQIRRNLTAG